MRHESLRPSHHMHGNIAAQPNFLMDKLYLVPCERLLSKNSRHLSCIPVRSAPPQAQAGAHETLNLLEAVTNARISAVCGSPPATNMCLPGVKRWHSAKRFPMVKPVSTDLSLPSRPTYLLDRLWRHHDSFRPSPILKILVVGESRVQEISC